MAPGTDRYRESRVERQGEGERKSNSQVKRKKKERGVGKEVGGCRGGESGESEMECVEERGREEDK